MFATVPFSPARNTNGKTGAIETQSLGKPASSFPAAIASDQKLAIAVDRLQTVLAVPLDTVSTTMTVANASQIVQWMLLSIDSEIVQVTAAPTGNQVPIARGFDGTTPALHLASAAVTGFVDAYHHNTLVSEVQAIETALGTNLSNLPMSAYIVNTPYIFAPQAPGGSLIAGANSITLAPVPPGVNGSDTGHSLYISGGTGAAEAAQIIGGSAVGGAPSGTLIIQCANAHSGAWTIQSATGGVQEAISAAPAAGSKVLIASNITLHANVVSLGKQVVVEKLSGVTVTNINTFSIYGVNNSASTNSDTYMVQGSSNMQRTTGPAWTTNYGNWDGFRMNVNNFPENAMWAWNTQPAPNAICGVIQPPSNAMGPINAVGVAGYAIANGFNLYGVGILGFGMMNGPNMSTWGGNFCASNQVPGQGAVGYDIANLYGIEVDVSILKKSDGTNPGHVTRGVFITGGSTCQSGTFIALDIDSPGVFQTPKLKWDYAIRTVDGGSNYAMYVGTTGVGNSVGSQTIALKGRDAGGAERIAQLFVDYLGDFYIMPGAGSLLTLADGLQNPAANIIPAGSNPRFQVQNQFITAQGYVPPTSSSTGSVGMISWDANYLYVCIAPNTWKRTALSTW